MLSTKSMVTMYHKQKAENEIAYIPVQNGCLQSFLHDAEIEPLNILWLVCLFKLLLFILFIFIIIIHKCYYLWSLMLTYLLYTCSI